MKKIFALVLATMLLVAMAVPAMAVAADPSVSVSGLMAGDTVRFYQVLKWDDTIPGWALADGFTSLQGNSAFGTDAVADIIDGLTQEQANVIASLASGATPVKTDANITGTTSTYTLTDVLPAAQEGQDPGDGKPDNAAELGMYMAVITAGTPEYVYNPVFVSADFKTDNGTQTLDASAASSKYGSDGIAKRQKITVEKTTEDANSAVATAIDSKVGETVTFHVVTTIPVFLDSYTAPYFVINDKIDTTGIELVANSISVKLNTTQYDAGHYTEADIFTVEEISKTEYTVTFDDKYLSGNTAAVTVQIDYQGTITNAAAFNANEDDNTVTVTYSNGPTTEKGALRDRTNHYTFSIGAKAFGETNDKGKTYELVKVAVDGDGNPVVEKKEVSTWETIERHPLEGALFGLYPSTDPTCEGNPIATFETLDDGIITFKGLDASTYYIKEITAPGGYVKDNSIVTVVIDAHYKDAHVDAETDSSTGIEVAAYDFQVLDYYTVSVNNVSVYDGTSETYGSTNAAVVSTYTFENDGKGISGFKDDGTTVNDSELVNTPGVELPSTGGMGTTIFYVAGSILVLAAVIFLVTKRRMHASEE